MNPILYILYHLLKVIVRLSLRAFYPRTTVIGREHLHFEGPAIVVSNHPNTLLDAMHVVSRVKEPVFFLANASLFKGTFQNWFFSTLYCIPVERPKDVEGRRIRNEENFAKSYEHLAGGGNIWIAPEGGSEMERRLRPFRTGTARIALGAEKRYDYRLGLRIVPVGLTYEAPYRFGSRVVIRAGEPVWVKNYREADAADHQGVVRQMTRELEERVRALLIDTRDEEEDRRVRRLETLLRNSAPVPEARHLERTQALIGALRRLEAEAPLAFKAFAQALDSYIEQLARYRTSDRAVLKGRPGPALALAFLAGLPLFAYGALNNLLPALLPRELSRRLDLYIGYHSTAKVVVGLVTFPLFYWLQSELVEAWLGTATAWGYVLSLPPAGYFAWWYARRWRQALDRWRLPRKAVPAKLREQRRPLWEQVSNLLEKAKA